MASNYQAVVDAMSSAGLLIGGALEVGTGKTVRVRVEGEDREKRGWYRLSEVLVGDEYHLVGAWGIWHGNDNGKQVVKPGPRVEMSREQREAIAEKIKSDTAKAKAQRQAEADRAAAAASRAWRSYEATGHSDYLDRKGVGAYGVRFHPAGTIAVPMMDERGNVWGLQIIRGRNRGKRLEKENWPRGLAKVGHFHIIGGSPRGVTLLCEGYATAASVHEATGLPAVVAFDAGNLLPVAKAIRKAYRGVQLCVCADDDYRTAGNPGVTAATNAALAVDGTWLAPVFAADRPTETKGPTDFNDLHALDGLATVRAQIDRHLAGLGWAPGQAAALAPSTKGGGDGVPPAMAPRLGIDEAVARYWGTYGFGGKVLFDEIERRLVHKDDVLNLLPRHGLESLREHPGWRVARDSEIGFDPTEADPQIRCNLFGGWPTEPKAGDCSKLLGLLEYLCDGEPNGADIYQWVLRWLAYPLQHRGAKMQTAIVVHGPQGTGKSLFFESYAKIFGEYARVLGQEAIEDKFNADWAEKKLFILAEEVLARAELYHIKNRLKGFVTGSVIRVNPKNVAAHNEKNQMNIVFLSNERQPLVLEHDDRRHCVIWAPPAPTKDYFDGVMTEVRNGGVAALHHYLLHLDLGDFHVAASPPMSESKGDLIQQSASSEDRFVREWRGLQCTAGDGAVLPFCPCLGSDLYRAYQLWCDRNGERRRRAQDLIGYCNKLHGWTAGKTERTWASFQDRSYRARKMVVPNPIEVDRSVLDCATGTQARLLLSAHESKTAWMTAGYFAFSSAIGGET
jgi:putative DNA primase/helicase